MRVFFMVKSFVVFDGANLYRKLKQIGIASLLTFDYARFARWLAKGTKVISINYYVGQIREEIRNPKSKQLKRDQDRLFAQLTKQKIIVKTGYILKSKTEYFENGVDVQIAVDICMKAVRSEYDKLILVSSDTDLIPAIKEIQSLKKEVEYIGFDTSPSFAMIRFSNSRTLLKKIDLLQFAKGKV